MKNYESLPILAARCTGCGAIVADRIDVSQISYDTKIIRCKICGETHIEITRTHDEKIRIVVPCLACDHSHPYTIGEEFFEKELFLLQCSYTGLDICFIGTEQKVDEALRLNAKQLKEIYDMNKKEEESQNFLDANIMQEVMYAIEELAITNRIKCDCKEPNLAIVVDYDKVRLSCKDCGRKITVYATENDDIDKVSEMKVMQML